MQSPLGPDLQRDCHVYPVESFEKICFTMLNVDSYTSPRDARHVQHTESITIIMNESKYRAALVMQTRLHCLLFLNTVYAVIHSENMFAGAQTNSGQAGVIVFYL